MHDLLYNDLNTFTDPELLQQLQQQGVVPGLDIYGMGCGGGVGDAAGIGGVGGVSPSAAAWQFEGDFGSDSFWGFMNSYIP